MTSITINLDGIPPALKNSQRIMRSIRGRRAPYVTSSDKASRFREYAALVALGWKPRDGSSLFGSHEIGLEVIVDEARKRTRVIVTDLGQSTRKRIRDLQNTLDLPCDVLQGIAYDNDRQIAQISARFGDLGEQQ